ncbi:HEAT repeat protein [Nannizzia gypsea CBS 118893]|uniref:HEAT repeat protein n=1 Tax=Arthroderma gypseum (strain ATCC MYA-4604 / CBS 118893) TaxID=535722 RepID=E5QYR5_ARTGP|nr:HEAT repeat protein [Nannizzia gypsea CBS 118893]EFQ97253.1 HEAT repeat protein [Nannizzia gypsea CBS 118893]
MSSSEAAAARPSSGNGAVQPRAELDVSKLHALPSEQQDLYLLTYTSDLVQYTVTLDKETLCAQQNFIKQELFKILRLVSPVPTRVIRNGIGRCFSAVFSKGNRATLFDTVTELIGILNAGKNEVDLKTKFAAVVALGDIFAAAGDGAVGLSSAVCSAILKALKLAQNNAGLRYCVFVSLKKVVAGIGSPIDEATARDIWKYARNAALSDKAYNVQVGSCVCLQELVKSTPYFRNSNDYEHLKTTLWKVMDSSVASVRHGAAGCLATFLVKAHSSMPTLSRKPTALRTKKPLKRQPTDPVDGDIIERTQSPSGRKADSSLSFKMEDLLAQLSSHYCKSSTGNRARAAIAVCYELLLKEFGGQVVEDYYTEIADHLLVTLLNHQTVAYSRYRLLLTRKFVKHILEDVLGREMLRESSQLTAVKWISNNILKDYPQVVPERREPSKYTLISAVSALSSLIESLGSAAATVAETCREALLQSLQHPSFSVQVHIAHCMRNFVVACPQQLLSCVTICMNSLTRELGQLSSIRMSASRCLGYAHALSAMLSTSRLQPLYGSVDVYAKVLSQATDLLKTSGDSELRVASTQIQVAWILIGGLMPLGPNFTKIHLSQLLLLWKNALSPIAKETLAKRGPLEMSFLAHVKECALSSILVFLEYNSKLVTLDGLKRIAMMLQGTVSFLEHLPKLKSVEDISQRLSPSLQLADYATLVRRRVLQCFTKLVNLSHLNPMDNLPLSGILGLAISCFADPDVISANPLETSIAASTANFDTLWDLDDNFGFGVTGFVRKFMPGEPKPGPFANTSVTEATGHPIDSCLTTPMCHAREHDSILLYYAKNLNADYLPDPPPTEVVNSAIELFSVTLPLQNPKVQESSVEQIATMLSSHSLNRNPGRKAAMTANIAIALLYTLRVSVNETPYLPGNLKHVAVEKLFQELIQNFIISPDYIIRKIGFEGLGRLCNSSGNAYTNSEINRLVDVIVENRDPHARAGCAAALGSIHAQVGGMAAGFHLKTIVGVLMSLCNDPHPVVHFWALDGLVRVIDSAGLTFSAYVSGAFGMLARLYVADTHNHEAPTVGTSNFEAEFSTPLAIGRCVDALVNVVGPDLRDVTKTRDLVFTIVKEFQLERDAPLINVSSQCLDHLSLYAPQYMDFSGYVQWLQKELASTDKQVKQAAVYGLSNLMKRDANRVLQTASSTFEDELWIAIDNDPGNQLLRDIIVNWLQQTGLTNTKMWIERCQKVLTKTRSKRDEASSPPPVTTAAPSADLPDEEVAGFATAVAGESREANDTSTGGQELLKWQTRNFVVGCLSELLTMVQGEILPDQTIPAEAALQEKVGDIVRMAFSASTANVIDLRIWGLKILDQVLKLFGRTPDPDFAEASLLEQYQAQIASALTPAFAADSSPELVSEAINVCATFVGTGIVTSVERMGRIFKLLVVGLENFANKPDMTEIGDLKGLNSNARVMAKLALYSAWARLQISSSEQAYLVDIVSPYTAMLTPLWLSSLQEFARLRFEPEISSTMGSVSLSDSPDDIYSALNREILLKFYQDSWLNFVDAIASLVEKDSDFVFDALNGKQDLQRTESNKGVPIQSGEIKAKGNQINYRDEPVAFFFVLFGLAFDALVSHSCTPAQTLDILQALQKILHPSVAGNAVYQETIFSETIDTLNRMVMTENLSIQSVIVQIVRSLSLHHPSATRDSSSTEHLSDDIEQLFELTRNIILVIAGVLPNLGESSPKSRSEASEESISLIQHSLSSLVDITSVFPSIIRDDLHTCIMHIFTTVFATGSCQAEIVPKILPIFKRFLQKLCHPNEPQNQEPTPQGPEALSVSRQVRGCLARFLGILAVAQRRESDTSLPCAKNTLLGITILLTSAGSVIQPQDPLISQAMQELLDCLQDLGLGTVAAGCVRSLLLNPGIRSATDDMIARTIFPRLLAFVTETPMGNNNEPPIDPENMKSNITQALVSFVGSPGIAKTAIPAAMALLIPALLARAKREGASVYQETATRLLELAKVDQTAFRGFATNMEQESKGLLEEILKTVGQKEDANKRHDQGHERNAPTIALRMDF